MTMYIPSDSEEEVARNLFGTLAPIWAVKTEKGEKRGDAYLRWGRNAYNVVMESMQARAEIQLLNLLLYQGIQCTDYTGNIRGDNTEPLNIRDPRKFKELIINELYDYVEQKTSKLSRLSITTLATPHSSEHKDRQGAKVVRDLFETIKYQNNLRSTYNDMQKHAIIFGYSFIMPCWDKDKSDLDPRWVKAKEKLGDKKGTVKIDGEEYEYDPNYPERIGDIAFHRPLPWQLGLDHKSCPEEVEWILYPRYEHIECVKWAHPELASKIKAADKATQFNIDMLYNEELKDHVLVIEVYGRSTKYLNDGLHFKMTPDVMLIEPTENPYPRLDSSVWGNLPLEWLTDFDIPGKLYPASTFQVLAGIQDTENKLYTQMRKNLLLNAHPKMAIPRQGKIKFGLANDSTNVEYTAPFAPTLLSMQAIPPELIQFTQTVEKKITQLQGLQGISKGDIDSNIRSGKQISLLQELEAVRGSPSTQKRSDLVVSVDRKVLSIVGKYYKDSEERLLLIVGKDKKTMIKSFQTAALSKSYDVRLVQSDAFPETPTARIQSINELIQNPQMFQLYTPEQWQMILDLGTPEKFHDDVSVSILKGEWENEEFVDGSSPPLPLEGDDHINHWKVHMTLYRSQGFLEFSEKVREAFKTHIMVHEMMMAEHMKNQQNPFAMQMFGQKLAMLSGWPAFFTLPAPEPTVAPGATGQVNGQALAGAM